MAVEILFCILRSETFKRWYLNDFLAWKNRESYAKNETELKSDLRKMMQ